MNDQLISHYKSLLEQYGHSPQAVQWRDQLSQVNRFRILSQISTEFDSILDCGAGFGDFYHFLCSNGFKGKYLGLEFVEEFVNIAKKAMIDDPKAEFQLFDVNSGALPTGFDYGFVSGMFNIRHDGNEFMMYDTLTRLWDVCEKGIAFNVLSTFVEYYDDNLYYVDPSKMFLFLKQELKGHVAMHHDYILSPDGYPYEVTFHVTKQPRFIGE